VIKNREDIPEKPGVYLFKSGGKILYIGKARNLRKRIDQYFQARPPGLASTLIESADTIETIITDDEKDALHLEYNLVHHEKPPFNIRLKDDKSFPYIAISIAHPFPGISYTRRRETGHFVLGPVADAGKTRELIDLVCRLFKVRPCTDRTFKMGKACLYYYIDRCSAPCTGKIDRDEYAKSAAAAVGLLKGKKKPVLARLRQDMDILAGELRFEEAQKLKEDTGLIEKFALETYISSSRLADYDVLALHSDPGHDCFIILFSVVQGRVRRREFFNFTALPAQPEEVWRDFLVSFYRGETIPPEILLPLLPAEWEHLEELFSRLAAKNIHIKVPVRGDKKKMLDLALKNLNLYVGKNKYSLVAGALQEKLGLSRLPVRIEGFDISHFSERERVGAAVTFLNGRPDKKNYRNYLIRTAGPGDPAALQEMLQRRFKKGETRPDLLVIDGGQPQLGVALAVRESLEIDVDVVALAKGEERVYLADGRSLVLAEGSAERFLLQNVRDEVHRRAVTHHRKRREQV